MGDGADDAIARGMDELMDSLYPAHEPTTCRYCGEPKQWVQLPNGKWRLRNADGTLHFCTQYSEVMR